MFIETVLRKQSVINLSNYNLYYGAKQKWLHFIISTKIPLGM